MKKRSRKTKNSTDTSFSLKDLGIDEEMLKLIKPVVLQLISELLIKKTANFAIEQKNISESINNNTKEKNNVLNQNVFSFRSVLLTITGFSLTIIGAVLSALVSNKDIFGNEIILYLGLACFTFSIIISILFILNIYHFENNKISEQIKFNNANVKEINKILKDNFLNKTFENYLLEKQDFLEKKSKEEEEINNNKNMLGLLISEKDYTPHLIIGLFLFGFILILLSFIKF
jgi:hypothetical protein